MDRTTEGCFCRILWCGSEVDLLPPGYKMWWVHPHYPARLRFEILSKSSYEFLNYLRSILKSSWHLCRNPLRALLRYCVHKNGDRWKHRTHDASRGFCAIMPPSSAYLYLFATIKKATRESASQFSGFNFKNTFIWIDKFLHEKQLQTDLHLPVFKSLLSIKHGQYWLIIKIWLAFCMFFWSKLSGYCQKNTHLSLALSSSLSYLSRAWNSRSLACFSVTSFQ